MEIQGIRRALNDNSRTNIAKTDMSPHRIKGTMYMQRYSCVHRGKMCMCDILNLPIQHHGQ